MAALNPIKPLFSASATATNGSAVINVTGNVDCSWLKPGSIVQLGTRQLVDAVSGTAPDGSGNSTITLRRNWADPTTTAPLLAFMSWEGLADAVVKLRAIAEANESALQGAFSFVGAWDAGPGDFPPAPAENTGTQMYRVSVAGTMGGRAYRVGEPIYYDQFTSQWRSFAEFASAYSTGLLALANPEAWCDALGLADIATSGNYNDLSDIPVLGTAASKNVTTSPTDTTAGRLMQVGDFGAGVRIAVNSGSFDSLTDNANYTITSSGLTQSPAPVVGELNVYKGSGGRIVQEFNQTPGGTPSPACWKRTFNGSVWGAWFLDYNQNTVLGTVSQSGGVPTGAIIERGANANGEHVKFADGTMICTRTVTKTVTINIAAGSLFRSTGLTPDAYAAEFISLPVASLVGTNIGWSYTQGGSSSNSQYQAILIDTSSQTSVSVTYRILAIGRWY